MVILELKTIYFAAIRLLFIGRYRYWNSIQHFFVEKNYKFFIGYLCYGNKVKPLNIMLPKATTYVNSYDGQTKWMYFWLKMMTY